MRQRWAIVILLAISLLMWFTLGLWVFLWLLR